MTENLDYNKSKLNMVPDDVNRFIFDNASDAIFQFTREGTIISANEGAIECSGYNLEELLALSFINLFTTFSSIDEMFGASNVPNVKIETQLIQKSGKRIHVELYSCWLNDSIRLFLVKPKQQKAGSLTDVKRLEAMLHLSMMENVQLSEITNFALEHALKLTQSEGGFIAYIKSRKYFAIAAWLGNINGFEKVIEEKKVFEIENLGFINDIISSKQPYISDNSLGFSKLFVPDTDINFSNLIILPVGNCAGVEMVVVVCNKPGNYVPDDSKQLLALMNCMLIVLNRKRSEQKLKESEQILKQQNEEFITINEELNQSNKKVMEMNDELRFAKIKAEEGDLLKSSFLANMSHEIRTPMNAINGFAELLKQPNLGTESVAQYVDIINSNSQQLLSIIDDIIDISKIESGQISILYTNVNINRLLDNVALTYMTMAKNKGIAFHVDYGLANEEAYTKTDETRLRQILNNLLNNALKFTNRGQIILGYKVKNKELEFFVTDSGIGIEQQNFDVIFERFRQIESGMSRKYGGTGLGLTISRVLVELLGGKIWLFSKINEGSTFYFTIPLESSAKQGKIILGIDKTIEYNWDNKTILVAEDEDFNFYLIHEILSNTKAQLLRAKNGKEAIEVCQENDHIDLVLMDIKMPELDGYEATKIIKTFRPQVPIIAQTAYAMSEDRSKALKAGCDNYISKPINKNRLLSMIHSNIEK